MNITLACPQFLPDAYGGVETYTYNLALEFVRRGHCVHVVCTRQSDKAAITTQDEIYDGIPVRRILFDPSTRPVRPRQIMYDPTVAELVRQSLQEWNTEIFHVIHFSLLSAATISMAKQFGIPVVLTAADFTILCARIFGVKWNGNLCFRYATFADCWDCIRPRGMRTEKMYAWVSRLPKDLICSLARLKQIIRFKKLGWLDTALMVEERLKTLLPLLRQIDLIIAPSTWLRDALVMNGAEPTHVIFSPYGINTKAQPTQARVANVPLRFAFLGRIDPLKGIDILVDAFNRLAAPQGATLTIYGAPVPAAFEYAGRVWAMAKDNPGITFGKKVNRGDVDTVLGTMDVLVVPSVLHENTPIVILEAQSHRVPVIASRIAGVADLIRDGENGLLFEMGDAADLASKIQRLIDEPELVQQLSSRIQPVKTIGQDAEWLLGMYDELIRKAKRGV